MNEMKKVGLITLFRNNYGSILQCYATKKYIESLGYDCVVFEEKKNNGNIFNKIIRGSKILYRSIKYNGYFESFKNMRNAMKKEINYLSIESKELMDKFINENLKPQIVTYDEIKKRAKDEEYIAFVVGSDQVWNASRDVSKFNFLEFAPRNKRITLAPSFGVREIPEFNLRAIKKGLSKFDEISVREEDAEKIIKSLNGKTALRLPDPTIIFNRNEWELLLKNSNTYNNYIFVHFLNEPNDLAIKTINKLVEKTNYKVIAFSYNYDGYKKILNIKLVGGSPNEYINYIKNANFVITDSFHSTLFSINLNTEFLTFDRQHLHKFSQQSRIENLLNRYNLSNRFIKEESEIEEILKLPKLDLDRYLSTERKKIKEYIKIELKNREE